MLKTLHLLGVLRMAVRLLAEAELSHEVIRVWDFRFYLNTASTEQQLERGLFEAVSSQIIKKQQVPQLVVLFDRLYVTYKSASQWFYSTFDIKS